MPIAPEDAVNAYRWLLGREPDDDEASLWGATESRDKLREVFMQSNEFINKVSRLVSLPSIWIAPRLPSDNSVEWQCDAVTETRFMEHIEQTWNRLGLERPHWSVLSAEEFSPEQIESHRAEFYHSGEDDLQVIKNILHNNDVEIGTLHAVVEYGCGVGRVTPFLAATFPRVVAIDISQSHLSLAKQRCAEHSNIEFVMSRVPEFGMTLQCDLWFSRLVLQHNPPPIIARVVERAFAMLAPAGVAIFQVTTWRDRYRFRIADYLTSRPREPTIEVHCLPQRVIFELARRADCHPLEIRKDGAMAPPVSWASHTFAFRKAG